MGSSLDAFLAGYKPATKPTKTHTTSDINIQNQGATNPPPKALPTKLPRPNPNTIPANPPIWQITIASTKNWLRIAEAVAPRYEFKSNSDSEIILFLYKEGELQRLNGMFSFVIYDGDKLTLSRDWVGKIPLYIHN